MARRTTVALAAAGGLALSLLPASVAMAAGAFDEVLTDYQADGQISQCAHSEKTLRDAQRQIPNDIQQHAPDFPDALSAALRQRAAGTCEHKQSGGGSTTPAAGGSGGSSSSGPGSAPASASGGKHPAATSAKPKPGAPPTSSPVAKPAGGALAASTPASASASKGGTPLPIILLAIIGGLLLVIGLAVWFARFMGWGLDRWEPALHTLREASYRTENALSEFADWARFGR
jgi:cobalamin biosynthesis Mg chelatase CobN